MRVFTGATFSDLGGIRSTLEINDLINLCLQEAMAPCKSRTSKKVDRRKIPKGKGDETHPTTSTSPLRLESCSRHSNSPTKSIELQQQLLNIFRNAFVTRMNDDLPLVIQQVKQHLFNREFDRAFNEESLLEAYAIRWSSSRALAYLDVLNHLPHLSGKLSLRNHEKNPQPGGSCTQSKNDIAAPGPKNFTLEAKSSSHRQANGATGNSKSDDIRIVCFGGGAGAEIVALAGYFHCATSLARDNPSNHGDQSAAAQFDITALDVADWSGTMEKIRVALTTEPPLSRFASALARDVSVPLVDASRFKVHFLQQDILQLQAEQMKTLLANVQLVTLMFTLNELYNTSISATTNMLLSITAALPPAALFLIVDSPGSYSTVNIGAATPSKPIPTETAKKYPMQWLLDHTLLEAASVRSSNQNKAQEKQWEKLYSNDSRWFRLPPELTYSVSLEDIRCQVHLYRRL